jgi:hypothetical protein
MDNGLNINENWLRKKKVMTCQQYPVEGSTLLTHEHLIQFRGGIRTKRA